MAACATNPVTGRRSVVLLSSEHERELGAEEAAKVAVTMGLVDDAELLAYVRQIGARLVAQVPNGGDYHFQIVDMTEPNAFALPGGYVYVSRGLLALANSEDELAGVIGHEIGHVAARHAAQRVSLAAPLGIATGVAAIATGIVAPRMGGLIAGVGGLTTELVTNPYSRGQEREADEMGQRLAGAAGWDPAGLATFLRTLEREERLTQGRVRTVDFFASHPSTPSRVADADARARTTPRGSGVAIAADRPALLRRLDGLVIGPNPANGVVRDERFLHPDLDVTVRFPETWSVRNRPVAVVGVEPSKRAAIVLEVVGEGSDPLAAARAFAERNEVAFGEEPRAMRVGALRAARAATTARDGGRTSRLDLAWIAHDGRIFGLVGVADAADASTFTPRFTDTLASFRPLTATERDGIDVVRLRTVTPRGGESLEALVARTGSEWALEAVAVANAIEPAASVSFARPLKIARRERYRPRGGS